ncbi:MAG TPA: hypothetical protein VF246_10915 [Acidimicrobiia bacterium]
MAPGTTPTVSVPPKVGMVRTSGVAGGGVVVVTTEVEVVGTGVEIELVEDPGTVVDPEGLVVVVESGVVSWIGAASDSPTRSSARLTICQVTAVAATTVTSQIAKSCHLRMGHSPTL